MEAGDNMNITCVGSGTIGRSWALLFALRDHQVILYDISHEVLNNAINTIKIYLNTLYEERLIDIQSIDKVIRNIENTTDLKYATENAKYIQESVPENLSIKKNIFKKLDEFTSPETILASSTSGLFMSDIQSGLRHSERCIVVHPINPPHLIPLVEIVPGKKTSSETINKTYKFMLELGKIPILVKKEVPGFIFNRLAAALWREALSLLNNDVATVEDIDKEVTAGLGFRWAIMGPFLTYHFGGGEGGLEHLIDHFERAFSTWLKSMETWTTTPYSAAKKAIMQTKEIKIIKDKSRDDILKWRDKKLIQLLKLFYPQLITLKEKSQ